jgi:hypothetical protein
MYLIELFIEIKKVRIFLCQVLNFINECKYTNQKTIKIRSC